MIHVPNQEYVLVFEFACCLLGAVQSSEFPAVNKGEIGKNGLVLWLDLVGDIFASQQVDHKWVKLVSHEGGQNGLIGRD